MGFVKQAKIKAWQAKAWMKVCHRAMQLFPRHFPVTMPATSSPSVICKLLEELAAMQEARRPEVWPQRQLTDEEVDALKQEDVSNHCYCPCPACQIQGKGLRKC